MGEPRNWLRGGRKRDEREEGRKELGDRALTRREDVGCERDGEERTDPRLEVLREYRALSLHHTDLNARAVAGD